MNFRRHMLGTEGGLLQVTPLLNVVFLLLCLFVGGMAFAPAADEVGIHLPVVAGGQAVEHVSGEMIIDIAATGALHVKAQALTADELRARLVRLAREVPESVVRVRADHEAPLAQVLGVLEACRFAEIDNYHLIAVADDREAGATAEP